MDDEKIPKNINLSFQDDAGIDLSEQIYKPKNHANTGPSTLYGRRGDNLTYVNRGMHSPGYYNRMWSWVWKDLIVCLFGIFRVLFSRYK